MPTGNAAKKRLRKKNAKARKQAEALQAACAKAQQPVAAVTRSEDAVAVTYVSDTQLLASDPNFEEFQRVFAAFSTPETLTGQESEAAEEEGSGGGEAAADAASGGDGDGEEGGASKQLSNRNLKLSKRLSVAELKQLVRRPDVVEVWDATASDPRLLAHLKAYRNTVAVPKHWNQKRKYLQGKRGIEKPPFQLPDFIEATGISKIREAYFDKEAEKSSKQKGRERTKPSMGKMDVDYQVLHDAFFRFQTKPKLTRHGQIYYEGKEFEVNVKEKRPGVLSAELRAALGMPEGELYPPPWLINMQRYGPPPTYTGLKIAGLNAAIPEGAQFGFHPGGWGKPPVNELGQPLYGDVFGTAATASALVPAAPIEKEPWGELLEEESEEEEEEAEPAAAEDAEDDNAVSGISSVASTASVSTAGAETPGTFVLRKDQEEEQEKALYQVIESKEASVGSGIVGSSHHYVMPSGSDKAASKSGLLSTSRDVEVNLNPEDFGSDEAFKTALREKYEESLSASSAARKKGDVSDVVRENEAKRKRKLEKGGDGGKKKSFKF